MRRICEIKVDNRKFLVYFCQRMKVKATTFIEAELSPCEQKRVAIETIRKMAGWPPEHWVDLFTKKLMITQEFATSHRWSEDKILREASEAEIAIQIVLNYLSKTTIS